MKLLTFLILSCLFFSLSQSRFWTAINDQNANCWNSANNLLGMTWTLYPIVVITPPNVVHVGCGGCNAYFNFFNFYKIIDNYYLGTSEILNVNNVCQYYVLINNNYPDQITQFLLVKSFIMDG